MSGVSFISSLVPQLIQVSDPGGVYLCTLLPQCLATRCSQKSCVELLLRGWCYPETLRLTWRAGSRSLPRRSFRETELTALPPPPRCIPTRSPEGVCFTFTRRRVVGARALRTPSAQVRGPRGLLRRCLVDEPPRPGTCAAPDPPGPPSFPVIVIGDFSVT